MSTAPQMPAGVAISRADICAACPTPCALNTPEAHAVPANACPLPVPRWNRWGYGETLPSRPASSLPASGGEMPAKLVRVVTNALAHRVRGMMRAGLTVSREQRRARSAACLLCPHAKPSGLRGLWICGRPASCGCVGGREVDMILTRTKCQIGKWDDIN
jgi:hypothetical protein